MHATDRATLDKATATFAPVQIGRHRYELPNGFVLWEGVRIARVGPMLYAPEEMPDIEPGDGAMIVIERDADVLFEEDAIMSFSGMDISNDHPPSPVDPDNYKAVTVGVILNPRQGEGVEADYLVGDFLVKDRQAILDVDAGKREVSAGYDVEVVQIKPGLGRQTKIVGNHVALVKRGRAGPSCAINDEEPEMAQRTRTIFDRLRTAFKANDEAAFEEELKTAQDEGENDPQTLVIKIEGAAAPAAAAETAETTDEGEAAADPVAARFDKLEATLAGLVEAVSKLSAAETAETASDEDAGGEKKDDETEANDEDPEMTEEVEKTTAMDALAKAEILAPGIKLPTFDSAKVKGASIVALKRQALKKAYVGDAKPHVVAVLGARKADFDAMKPAVVSVVFDAAATLAKAANNASARARPMDIPQGPMTAAKLQATIVERRKAS